jgi:hypothetical protein
MPSSAISNQRARLSASQLKLIYPKIERIFNLFWDIDIADPSVVGVFFGRINAINYLDFGFTTYIDGYCNLTVIKVGQTNVIGII